MAAALTASPMGAGVWHKAEAVLSIPSPWHPVLAEHAKAVLGVHKLAGVPESTQDPKAVQLGSVWGPPHNFSLVSQGAAF